MSVNVRFVNCNKYTILVQDVAGKEVVTWGQKIYGNSVFSTQLFCKPNNNDNNNNKIN